MYVCMCFSRGERASCWYILISGYVFIDGSMFCPGSRSAPPTSLSTHLTFDPSHYLVHMVAFLLAQRAVRGRRGRGVQGFVAWLVDSLAHILCALSLSFSRVLKGMSHRNISLGLRCPSCWISCKTDWFSTKTLTELSVFWFHHLNHQSNKP